ncbi:MAG: hypothetical protein ACYCT9_05655 [Leptospirillum sp.]|jgi:hypothetical protein
MVGVQPPDPSGGGISMGPDPLLGLLRLLRMEPKGVLSALLSPLRSSSPFLWSVSLPGLKVPLILSLPPESLPPSLSRQSVSGILFEENKQLFFKGNPEVESSPPLLLLLGNAPVRGSAHEETSRLENPLSKALLFETDGAISDRSIQTPVQMMAETYSPKSGDVPNLFQKVDGPAPPGLLFPGGAPPSVLFEICWPDQRDAPSPKKSGDVLSASFSFRLSVSYATGENLDLAGVYDPSSAKLSLYPRTSSPFLMAYWNSLESDLGAALEKNVSILLERHRKDHG